MGERMSGSGGSDDWKYRGTGRTGPPPSRPGTDIGGGVAADINIKCNIRDETPLNSPDPAVIRLLRRGDMLALQIQGRSLVALTPDGKRAGSVTSRWLVNLLECIEEEGWTYVAEVKQVTGGLCIVVIRPGKIRDFGCRRCLPRAMP